jgi:hypothetical protein
MKKLLIGFVFLVKILLAQEPDKIYMNNIKSVKLFQQNNQLGYPIINLNAGETLELHFDDLDGRVKNIIILINYVMPIGLRCSLAHSII